jgi:hypothetical protein
VALMRSTRITLGVTTNSPELLTRAIETLSRSVAGLAMEGVDTTLMVYEDETEEDE